MNEDLREGKATTAEGEPEGLYVYPRRQTSIGVLAAKERDQLETERTVETEEQRQVRREQACVNLERQNAERREDRLRVHARETRPSESQVSKGRLGWSTPGCTTGRPGHLREVSKGRLYRLKQTRLHVRETRVYERGEQREARLEHARLHDRETMASDRGEQKEAV